MGNNNEEKLSQCRLFLEPLDSKTNVKAFDDLLVQAQTTKEYIWYDCEDNEGVCHDVLEVTRPFIRRMENSVPEFHHKYAIFVLEAGREKMRRWVFSNTKKLAQTKEVRRVAGSLECTDVPKVETKKEVRRTKHTYFV